MSYRILSYRIVSYRMILLQYNVVCYMILCMPAGKRGVPKALASADRRDKYLSYSL